MHELDMILKKNRQQKKKEAELTAYLVPRIHQRWSVLFSERFEDEWNLVRVVLP